MSDAPRKFDQDKLRWDLMPWAALESVARVMTSGAKKYGDRNWEGGFAWSRLFGATMRHMTRWWLGEDRDPETGESHLAHACCCVLFLLTFVLRKIGKDDREGGAGKAAPACDHKVRGVTYPIGEIICLACNTKMEGGQWIGQWGCSKCGGVSKVTPEKNQTGGTTQMSDCCKAPALERKP